MINTKLLAEICEVAGAPGHEQRVREIVLREVKSLVDEIKIDNMGNVVAIKRGKENKKVMIAAHMDEIGLNERYISNAICANACQISDNVNAKAIITATYSGYNTIKTSSYRPKAYIYAFTNHHTILNTLSLVWGVKAFYYEGGKTTDETVLETKNMLKKYKYVKKGDKVINIASMPAQERGMTNMMKLSKVK